MRPELELVHLAASGQAAHRAPNRAICPPFSVRVATVCPAGARDSAGVQIDSELALGEPAAGCAWRLGLHAPLDLGLLEALQQRPVPYALSP